MSGSNNPYSFSGQQDFQNWLDQSNMTVRPSNTLRLQHPRPAYPQMMNFGDQRYPVSVPEPDPNYVWVSNRDDFSADWYPRNTPITEEQVGPTTFGRIGRDQTFQPQHHGVNVAQESAMTDQELRAQLERFNLPTHGNRAELFGRNMRMKLHPTYMRNFVETGAGNEAEINDIMGGNAPMSLQEAGRMRNLRNRAGYFRNVPQRVAQERPIPRAEGNLQNLAQRVQEPQVAAQANEIPAQANALEGEAQAAGEAAAAEGGAAAGAAAESGLMGGMGMMASRAFPLLNMVILGKMLSDGLTSDSKERKAKQRSLMYGI